MADTTLNLGSFQFQDLEIPAEIAGLAGMQSLAVHKFVGGARTVDAMGKDYPPLQWGGLFFGSNAVARAQTLQTILDAGAPVTLTWGAFNYTVIVREYLPDYRRAFEIPYRISCEVVADNTSPVAAPQTVTADSAVEQDLDSAQTLVDTVDDSTLSSLMDAFVTAVSVASASITITPSLLASVLQPLAAVQAQVTLLIGNSDTDIDEDGFAGVIVGASAAQMVASLEETESAAIAEYTLLNLQGLCGRMAVNIASASASPNTLAVAGNNLLRIASEVYGDALDWTAIATANGLTDPFLQTPTTLTLPLSPADNGGVLSP